MQLAEIKIKPPAKDPDTPYSEPSHKIFKEMFEHARDAVPASHGGGALLYVNQGECEMTGYDFREPINF
jgi:PAS domain-containing protein